MIDSILKRLKSFESATDSGAAVEQIRLSLDECTSRFLSLLLAVGSEEKIALANNASLPQMALMLLSEDAETDVRYAVAENAHTPIEVLSVLSRDANDYVAERALRTLIWILYTYTCLEDFMCKAVELTRQREREAGHSEVACDQPTIDELLCQAERAEDKETIDWLIRMAEHEGTPAAVLSRLAQHAKADVRIGVSDNSSASVEIIQILATDDCADVRYALAENHNIEQSVLCTLAADDNPFVAQRANKTLQRLRQSVLIRGQFPQSTSKEERQIV